MLRHYNSSSARPNWWPRRWRDPPLRGPIATASRLAAKDLRIADRTIASGEAVILHLAAADRDPGAFKTRIASISPGHPTGMWPLVGEAIFAWALP